MEINRLLHHINDKVALSKDDEVRIISKCRERTFLKGQYVVQQGDISRYQTFILEGKVRTFCLDDKGNEHIVAFGIEDWWVGDICSFATQTPAEFSTQCLERTKVAQISFDDMQQLYKDVPSLERYFRLIVQSAYGNMTKRIVGNHALPAKERYLIFNQSYPDIANRVPLYMIASYLGITKEFLSSIRNKLAKEAKS